MADFNTVEYMAGRKKYTRPQALLFANNPGTVDEESMYIPLGLEVGTDRTTIPNSDIILDEFIILTDDNRGPIDVSLERIEKAARTVNGRMRSFHIADKLSLGMSWTNVPSRAYPSAPQFDASGASAVKPHTSDGGAGGAEILDWYERYTGSFWIYLAYDKYTNFDPMGGQYDNLPRYNEVVEVMFSDFSYSVVKRGGSTYDFWNIDLTLEEV
jgi:hypothetical protein